MSDKGSVFQKGGGGNIFELSVQTAFLTTLIIKGNAPCLPSNEIIEVAFQNTNKGYDTDDILVVAKSIIGTHRLLIQSKHEIVFSANDKLFQEVISAFWKDYKKVKLFDSTKDKLLIVKNGLTKEERNHLKSLFNWANNHATEIDFISEVNRIKGKKKFLDVFQESLKIANNNIELSDKELWQFIKCVDVLEYDFLNEGSIDKAYFFNLIKICKNIDSVLNENEIWNDIFSYVSKLNKDGGNANIESIKNEGFYRNFEVSKISPYFKAVKKIISDSEAILKPIKGTIGDFHIDRKDIGDSIVSSINNVQFTLVTGKPGVGKSAEVKEVLKGEFSKASVFVFRADQFSEAHIAKVFSSQGVNETIQDIFSSISLIPTKIIFIDSLEKLLEADPECAFKQLLGLLKEYVDIKIIATSRKYAIDLIVQKFGIENKDFEVVEVLPINDIELGLVSKKFPMLEGVLKNEKIKKLMQSPKYLDFAISALSKKSEDYTNITLTEFKNKLWESLVKNSTDRKNGLPAKREDAFMEIALNRAKEMKLFTKPTASDKEALDLLENDEIIFQEGTKNKYSPSHDILEDWALVKYVSNVFEKYPNPKELFDNLGNTPAIRRAFRLWIEDYIIDDTSKIMELIKSSLSDNSIERYWADEILVAVFKSENCSELFLSFEKELIENNGILLNRFIHLIKTCCKESSSDITSSILIPIGSGWKEAILYISTKLSELDNLRYSIIGLLLDWEFKFLLQTKIDADEVLAVKSITLYYIHQIELKDEFWAEKYIGDKRRNILILLNNLAHFSKEEITGLIERAFDQKESGKNWELRSFYELVIDTCLSGVNTYRLAKELPELIIDTAWKEWKIRERKEEVSSGFSRAFYETTLSNEECWGIEDKFSFFPPGVYKTPIYNILLSHPLVGITFLIEFLNYSIDFYLKAECKHKRELVQIEIELNDGVKIKQWGCSELWVAYRDSMSVTHYAIESLAMTLEKYLFEIAKSKTEISRKNLKAIFDLILRKSNNVSTTSVLVSVAIAYPEEVEEYLIPLFSVEEFYHWDMQRAFNEGVSNPMNDEQIPFAIEERFASKNLPHRKKYQRGLADFVIDYQFSIGVLNEKVHEIFDKLHQKASSEDIIWKKILNEIDIRKWEVKPFNVEKSTYVIQPKYDTDVTSFIESGKEEFEAQNISLNYASIISKAFEGNESISFESWEKYYKYYLKGNNANGLYSKPISLAVLGLKSFSLELTEKQKSWCVKRIINTVEIILKDIQERNYGLNFSYNLMEKEIALSSFHLVLLNLKKIGDKRRIIKLMIYITVSHFSDHEIRKLSEYFRVVFCKNCPDEAMRVWVGVLKYAMYKNDNPINYYRLSDEEHREVKLSEEKFINNLTRNTNLKYDATKINFSEYDGYILIRQIMITPYFQNNCMYSEFIFTFLQLLIEDLKIDENDSHQRRKTDREINSMNLYNIKVYLVDLIMNGDYNISTKVIDLLFAPIYSGETSYSKYGRNDLFDLAFQVPELCIYKLDKTIANSTDEGFNDKLIEHFWRVWEYLFFKIKSSGKSYFTKILFLDIKWNEDASDWRPLLNKKKFYHKMILEVELRSPEFLINLFSTAGEKTFLPEGLSWITDLLKKYPREVSYLNSTASVRLIKRLFHNHISEIKNNQTLINDFIFLLNRMVDFGSSEAYLFRENVITYKTLN